MKSYQRHGTGSAGWRHCGSNGARPGSINTSIISNLSFQALNNVCTRDALKYIIKILSSKLPSCTPSPRFPPNAIYEPPTPLPSP